MDRTNAETTAQRERRLGIAQAMLTIVAGGLLLSGLSIYIPALQGGQIVNAILQRLFDSTPSIAPVYQALAIQTFDFQMVSGKHLQLMLDNDWLGFAHFMLAVLFLGAIRDPCRNLWVTQFGLISAVSLVPAAFFFGALRGAPFLHLCIDAGFGAAAFVPLYVGYRQLRMLRVSKEGQNIFT